MTKPYFNEECRLFTFSNIKKVPKKGGVVAGDAIHG
jgi:hypothetical protein